MGGAMKKINFIFLLLLVFPVISQAFEVLGYLYRSDTVSHLTSDIVIRQNQSLKEHIDQLNIIAPQAYQVNAKGTVWGEVDPLVMQRAKENHVKVMPLLTNQDFERKTTTEFLNNRDAEENGIQSIVQVCEQEHYAGIQIDFEHIPLEDKNAFTQFYQQLSAALHAKHFLISVAIIPRITNDIPKTDHDRSALEYWDGAYDYKALGKASDFVMLMAYDQHGGGTTPGSPCEPGWLKKVILYALSYIPANKISVGLPVHSSYWYTVIGRGMYSSEADLTYKQAEYVLKEHNAKIIWDKKTDSPYAIFTQDNLNRYVFLQNAQTFKIDLALIRQYHLRGVSLWCLGYEDPEIWKILKEEK